MRRSVQQKHGGGEEVKWGGGGGGEWAREAQRMNAQQIRWASGNA